jgi:hypothetical protein
VYFSTNLFTSDSYFCTEESLVLFLSFWSLSAFEFGLWIFLRRLSKSFCAYLKMGLRARLTLTSAITWEIGEHGGGDAYGQREGPAAVLALDGGFAEQFVSADFSAPHEQLGPVGELHLGVGLESQMSQHFDQKEAR